MIFSENRNSTHRVKPEGMLFRIMLQGALHDCSQLLIPPLVSRAFVPACLVRTVEASCPDDRVVR